MTIHYITAETELRLQCPGTIYEALMGKGNKLPYLLTVCCGNGESRDVVACPDLRVDNEVCF